MSILDLNEAVVDREMSLIILAGSIEVYEDRRGRFDDDLVESAREIRKFSERKFLWLLISAEN